MLINNCYILEMVWESATKRKKRIEKVKRYVSRSKVKTVFFSKIFFSNLKTFDAFLSDLMQFN